MGSGILNVEGEVGGGIFSLSGEVHLAPTSAVQGHVTVTSVPFEENTGARIEKNVAADVSGWLGGPVGTALLILALTGYLFYWSTVHALILDRSESGTATRARVLTRVNLGLLGGIVAATISVVLLARVAGLESVPGQWALGFVVPSMALLALMLTNKRWRSALAVPTTALLITSAILVVQAITGYWESWSYVWALVLPTSVGLGRVIRARWSAEGRSAPDGLYYTGVGLALFSVGVVFFEIIASVGGVESALLLAVMMTLVAVFLLLTRRRYPGRMPTGT